MAASVLKAAHQPLMSVGVIVCALTCLVRAQSPFATRVVSYDPAPGQFVNNATFNDPARALGPPVGGGLDTPNQSSVVTLGAFGGSITLAFDHTVADDPLNPFGVDAIVFGNAFWVGSDAEGHAAELATIEISRDANNNGLADDPWYLVLGSHLPQPPDPALVVTWDDNVSDPTFPPELTSWIPAGTTGEWTTSAFELPIDLYTLPAMVIWNPAPDAGQEGVFGYADYSPTLRLGDLDADNVVEDPLLDPAEFYTVPDDPIEVGISPGAGGGDAFDIAWAVDPASGEPANLFGFDFIRLTTAVLILSGPLGELSTEIDAVADVAREVGDGDGDGDVDLRDAAELMNCFGTGFDTSGPCDRFDRQPDGTIGIDDARTVIRRLNGPS